MDEKEYCVREMTDKELAGLFADQGHCPYDDKKIASFNEDCTACWLNYLRREAENE